MELLPTAVYLLCLVTSAGCAYLLARSYLTRRMRLLLWAAVCFGLLAVNNLILVIDILLLPGLDLQAARQLTSLAAIGVLLHAFIWEAG